MRRMIALSREFNKKRMVFGKLAAENKLQASVLFDMVIIETHDAIMIHFLGINTQRQPFTDTICNQTFWKD